jgi:endonuclease/exonuclease/phosphatase (EEP) superfamily protein YafD
LLLAGVHLLVLVVTAWLVLHFYPGDRWMPVRLASYFAPWLFMALVPALGVAWLNRARWLSGWIAVFIIIYTGFYWPALVPRQPAALANAGSQTLRVMTFNVNMNNRNVPELVHLIRAESPDLIAFQEMVGDLGSALLPELKEEYPYQLVDTSSSLPLVLVSRYPLFSLPKPAGADRVQHALVETPAVLISVWNVHPIPVITAGWETQRATLSRVAEAIAREERPVIVLGDFNTTEQTDNYRLIARLLTDAHWAVGQGFGFTFPDLKRAVSPDQPWLLRLLLQTGPVVKIDHIFVSNHFTPLELHVAPTSAGSDHRPVIATLLW